MCSLQLHKVVSTTPSDRTFHSYKAQQRSMQRCHIAQWTTSGRVSHSLVFTQTRWSFSVWEQTQKKRPVQSKHRLSVCASASATPVPSKEILNFITKFATSSCSCILKIAQESQLFRQCAPAVGLMVFAMWGLGPLLRVVRHILFQKEDRSWKESQTRNLMTSYLRPVMLWIGIIMVCRAFDPLVLSSEASQAIKQRFLNFIRSLSTVLAFAYCTASLTQQLQKVMLDRQDSQDSRSVGAQFVGNAVYTAVWIAAVCLFMELLGFSTQKWLTAGGLGTVLLTLAGREIFTNFLSSIMIHATRPFVLNEWIQTKIDGYEVSGTVEHVGWWSPTIVRGDDREAVHIPNHKFTVSVVRNLSQKSHWRIKTHFGISHLDVSKIPSIVADMRKVLAKHPQVEQRRLHRRVFFENINHENQALLVLVSCFVKTPHFEEYLRVKETILLDLLKVISHHHARLATPIRSVQRVSDDMESRSTPFRDMKSSAEAQGRPYLLIEASAITAQRDSDQHSNGKHVHSQSKDAPVIDGSDNGSGTVVNENTAEVSVDLKGTSKHKPQLEGLDSMGLNSKDITLLGAAFEKPPANIPEGPVASTTTSFDTAEGEKAASKSTAETAQVRTEKSSHKTSDQLPQPRIEKGTTRGSEQILQSSSKKVQKTSVKGAEEVEPSSIREEKIAAEGSSDLDQSPKKADDHQRVDARRLHAHGTSSHTTASKQEMERSTGTSSGTKPPLQDNLVLGVALDGPKRTLPLDNEVVSPSEQKELVGSRNGNSNNAVKERRESPQTSNTSPPEGREK